MAATSSWIFSGTVDTVIRSSDCVYSQADYREEVKAIPHTVLYTELRRLRAIFIKKALTQHRWHLTKTAKSLKMRRSQLYHIITHDKEMTRIWKSRRMRECQRKRRKKAT